MQVCKEFSNFLILKDLGKNLPLCSFFRCVSFYVNFQSVSFTKPSKKQQLQGLSVWFTYSRLWNYQNLVEMTFLTFNPKRSHTIYLTTCGINRKEHAIELYILYTKVRHLLLGTYYLVFSLDFIMPLLLYRTSSCI